LAFRLRIAAFPENNCASMHICHITTVHPVGDARILFRMCCALAKKGLSVELIAPGEVPLNGVPVRFSSWNGKIAHAGRLQRIRLALQAALSAHANIYHFHDPELIPLGLALKVLRRSAAVVYDVHEDYPAFMMEKYWIPKSLRPLFSRGARYANAIAARCLDGIVTADPGVENDFLKSAGDKTAVYYNFPVLSQFEPSLEEQTRIDADLVYVGGMSDRAGTFVLLDALTLLARENVRPCVKLAGYTDGDEGRRAVQNGIQTRGLQGHVKLHGRLPYSQVPAWIRSGRIGLVTLQAIPKFMKNIPSKMFEYWACGLPVIASDLPPIRQFLLDGKNGLFFQPSSPEDLARAIRFLLNHPAEARTMGDFARELVRSKWNVDRQIDHLVNFYERI
jgi:glycosyltransferase involved in cell wall biosynthesis